MVSRTIEHDVPGRRAVVSHQPAIDRGRLGVYAALGASLSTVPLPWLPDSLGRRVRGSLLHDIAVRHGLSLTTEARRALAEPRGAEGPSGWMAQVARFVGMRLAGRALSRIGPWGLLWPARDALRTFVLGHLFERYLSVVRTQRAVRIDVDEARRVRNAIDGALMRALSVEPGPVEEPGAIDDQRDAATILVDGMLVLVAGIPARLVHRLDVAFEDLLAHSDG